MALRNSCGPGVSTTNATTLRAALANAIDIGDAVLAVELWWSTTPTEQPRCHPDG